MKLLAKEVFSLRESLLVHSVGEGQTEREREGAGAGAGAGQADSPVSADPDVGLHPRTLRSLPEPILNPLRHAGTLH